MSRDVRVGAVVPVLLLGALAGCLGAGPDGAASGPGPLPAESDEAKVVIAHIDTGINPYHATFRWDDARAWQHPSTWLAGYPADAPSLNLTLDAATYDDAVRQDGDVWAAVQAGRLYWIPGTRIVGAVSFGDGGTYCPAVAVPPANQLLQGDCREHRILDDFGHGTMTASRMAGAAHSLAPEGLVVSIEAGDVSAALDFVAESGFIDVVSNSWGSLLPSAVEGGLAREVEAAAQKALFLFASGNGLGFINGVVGQPTQVSPTFMPGVVIVGAHDNGYATFWHGAPVHVVADGYGGWRASARSLDEVAPSPESCCTSASAPYASGGAAAILFEARRLLGDDRTGLRGAGDDGVLAEGAPIPASTTPLSDGKFTLGELKRVLKVAADPRPPVTSALSDDGLLHWTGSPGSTPTDPWLGDNPYCVGCWTSPIRLADVAGGVPLAYWVGYGAVTPASVDAARQVLGGKSGAPDRSFEDGFFALESSVRGLVQPRAATGGGAGAAGPAALP